jgi:anti-sigma-K factor RskA
MSNDAGHETQREQVALYAIGALSGPERAAVEAHLRVCAGCTAELAAAMPVGAALAQIVPQFEPPASLRAAILADARRSSPARTRAAMPWMPWLAAAAMLVATTGLALYAGQLRQQIRRLEGELRAALLRVDEGERRVNVALRQVADAQAPLAVLTAPDVRLIAMAGQAAAPNASARAYWSRTRGLLLTGDNLPALPPGRIYQLWFVRGRTPVSAGLLQPDAEGRLRALLATPREIADPEVLAVTQEPAGGLPAPSGQMYLVGTVN